MSIHQTNGDKEWRIRVEKLTASVRKDLFPGDMAFEPDCEGHQLCDSDQLAYKGVNIRSLAVVTQFTPFTSETIFKALGNNAKTLALGCHNSKSGRSCQSY